MYKHKNSVEGTKPRHGEEAQQRRQTAAELDNPAAGTLVSPFNHNLLDMRKKLYIQDEPVDPNMINKLPTFMMSQHTRFSPKLRMKDHMLSFKTIDQGEMIKCGLASRKAAYAEETSRKQKDKMKQVQKTEDFQLSFFEE